MKRLAFLICFSLLTFVPALAADANTCADCHGKQTGRLQEPVSLWQDSVHQQVGIQCVNCHGGNPWSEKRKQAHSRANGWIGKPNAGQIVKLCGTCHGDPGFMKQYNPNARTDQLDNYRTSRHGENILQKKDGRAATCASCHGAHDVLKATNPRSHVYATNVVNTCASCHEDKELMGEFGISGDQVAEYRNSIHHLAITEKGDLFAPTCNDCHGNHGAVPPDVSSVLNVCGSCHAMNQQLFTESPHAFWEEGMCIECHNNHEIVSPTEDMLSETDGVCLNCHVAGETALDTMAAMHTAITGLKTGIDETRHRVEIAAEKGMHMDDAFLALQDAHNVYIQSRTAVHKFNAEHVDQVVKAGMTSLKEVADFSENALTEVADRRSGLLVFLGLLFIIVVLLGLKIRSMEK